jgi:propanol-preferring alcohol dehydrogenase
MNDGDTLGLTGFGASGHLVLRMAKHLFPRSRILVFARNNKEQEHARSLGAHWTGDIGEHAPELCHAIIDTTPVWRTTIASLLQLKPGGRLVINAIRKEDTDKNALAEMNYQAHLWMEKEIKSVANICREDIREFLSLAASIPIIPDVQINPFEDANKALVELKKGQIHGAKVLVVHRD